MTQKWKSMQVSASLPFIAREVGVLKNVQVAFAYGYGSEVGDLASF